MKKGNVVALQAVIYLLLSFMTVGCSKDEPVNSVDPVDNSRPTLVFSLRVADISIGGTRALTEADENQVEDVKLLLFDDSGNLVEMYTPELRNGGTTSSVYTIEVKDTAYSSAVLIANAKELIGENFVTVNTDKSKDEILSSLIVTSGKWNATSGSEGYMPIPMWGEVGEVEINTGANVTNVITFQMLRMLAKVNVTVNDDVDFTLESVRLYNYYDKGAVVPAADNFVNAKYEVSEVTIPENAEKPENAIQNPYVYTVGEGKTSLTNEIYTFEAGTGSEADYLKNTALVIGGKFGKDTKTTYYRFDFIDQDDKYLPLLRNHSYNVKVTSVYGSGQSTPVAAFESLESLLKAEIVVWNDVDLDADLGGSGGNPSGDGDGDGDGEGSGETEEGEDDQGGNGSGGEEDGEGEGDLPDTVRGESNSYIVKTDELIHIPVSRSNKSELIGAQLHSGDTYTAELLWQDEHSVVTEVFVVDNNDYIGVKTGLVHGNAVVAIKKDGVILWSWHIWVTNYEPTEQWMDRNLGATTSTSGELGSLGLYYQWGRKDPFIGPKSFYENTTIKTVYDISGNVVAPNTTPVPDPGTGGNNLSLSIANPTTFYTQNDWYAGSSGTKNDALWGVGSSKTVYDPCPEGYRVPEWSEDLKRGQIQSGKGVSLKDIGGFYPFAGNLLGSSRSISSVNTGGYYWSATVKGGNASYLDISSANILNNPRNNGFSVRCIKE